MANSYQNIILKEKYAIHKPSDSIENSFSHSYKDYLSKKKSQSYPTFFNTSKNLDSNIQKPIIKKDLDWLTSLIFSVIAIFIFARFIFYRRFNMLVRAFGSIRLLNQFLREGNLFKERFSIPLFFVYIFSYSLFAYQVILNFNLNFPFKVNDFELFGMLVGIVIAIYLFKLVLRLFLGAVFKTTSETYEHLINIYIFDTITALLIFPILIIQTYNNQHFLFFIGASLILIAFLYRLIRLTAIGMNKSKFSGYYLFLYLCSVEILPVLVFGKLAVIYLSV